MKDYSRKQKINSILNNLNENHLIYQKLKALTAYVIPYIGWMFPLYFYKNNSQLQLHGKQGFLINLVFLIIYSIWWVLQNFIPVSHEYLVNSSLDTVIIFYIISLFWGVLTVFWDLPYPYIKEKAKKLPL